MGVLWHKVWFDLWHNKTRTVLAVLSIAAGVFAVGAIFGMTDMMLNTMDASHRAVLATHVSVHLNTRVDRETILALRDVAGVEDVEPFNSVSILYRIQPDGEWRPGVIQMRDDYSQQKYELLQLRDGHWPEGDEIGIERMAAQFLQVGMGDSITFKFDEKERVFPITSLIRHPFVPPPQFQDMAFFFMDGEGMERFNVPDGKFGSFYVRVTPYSSDFTKEVATAIKQKLAKQDIGVSAFVYEDPNRHWGRTFFDGITWIQQLMAIVCVVISAILVYNTLSNLITQQTNQIGILKAVGGRTQTIAAMYVFSAFVYGLLAFLIAMPLGAFVAFSITKSFLNLFNIDFDQFRVSNYAITAQAIAALGAPLLAGMPPILKGAGITVREAIASYGLGGDFRSGWLDRVVEFIGQRLLPSHYATALGNMFRHKGRLLLTQLVMIAAGTAFLLVMSLNSSLDLTLDNFFARQRYDISIGFSHTEKASRLLELAQGVEGVEAAEVRFVQPASMFSAGHLVKEAGIGSYIRGIPDGGDFFSPLIVSGRWLMPGEGRVVVLSRDTAKKNDIEVGDVVTLDLGEMGQDDWQVVGLYEPVFVGAYNSDTIYAPLDALYQTTKKYGLAGVIHIRTTNHEGAFTTDVTRRLKEMYEAHNIKVDNSQTQVDLRTTNEWQFSIVTSMLIALSIIVAGVGGIALMGALSIGVIERTKEIGVLRAVGARSGTILGIFVMEGILQGVLSWLIAVPISLLVSPGAATTLGLEMFGATLDYQFNWSAVGIWLGCVVVISILASVLPGRGATRISVRDSLAYA